MSYLRFTGGLVLGVLVGGSLMLLFAPKSGAGTRAAVQDWFQAAWREGQEAAEARRAELMAQIEELRAPAR